MLVVISTKKFSFSRSMSIKKSGKDSYKASIVINFVIQVKDRSFIKRLVSTKLLPTMTLNHFLSESFSQSVMPAERQHHWKKKLNPLVLSNGGLLSPFEFLRII